MTDRDVGMSALSHTRQHKYKIFRSDKIKHTRPGNEMRIQDINIYCAGILSFVYIGSRSSYQEGRVGVPLTGLNPPHFCASPKSGHGFLKSFVVVFFCIQFS